MVPFYIPDDANLNATVLLMTLKIIGELQETRENASARTSAADSTDAYVGPGPSPSVNIPAASNVGAAASERPSSANVPSSSSGRQYRMPHRAHIKVDGVSSNWGKVMFALLDYLVSINIFDEILYHRGPVGR